MYNERREMLESKLNHETDDKKRAFLEAKIKNIVFEEDIEKRRRSTGPLFTYYN